MNKQDDLLKRMFDNLPDERPTADFRSKMMAKITAEAARRQKRSELWNWIILGISSVVMMGLGVAALLFMKLPKINVRMPDLSSLGFYCFIGIAALFLLAIDYAVRKHINKHKTE